MRWWIVGGVLAGAVAAATAAYFTPEETTIERGVLAEEIRRTVDQLGPLVNDLKK